MENRPPCRFKGSFTCPDLKLPPPAILQLKVVGLFKGIPFQVAKCTAEALKLANSDKFKDPIMVPLHEFAWYEFLREKKRELKGETWQYPSTVMCFINDQLLGNEGCLQKWAYKKWGYKDFKPLTLYQALTSDYVSNYLKNSKLDESFAVLHDKRGILGMANQGRHTNGSQFYITLQKAPYLDRKYVAFGQLIEGTRVLQILEVAETVNERPVYTCRITNCGAYN
ncbi:probable inactive peptidyl-prolyl cis-trans isomerase-like 6 [Gracilinanus agilis]|uniref:probable inactive peptidyl-prolyl cis-trans isomerase-like 6 n=1 Tax=Gracilinanus agilis TaxID=191870 RepID=UPI001CFC9577|nr:probable inactive peptidyl-prolyl cis-trans isomerase-like 6 [Gracilinanus agilis]